jgi:hypothetical protein
MAGTTEGSWGGGGWPLRSLSLSLSLSLCLCLCLCLSLSVSLSLYLRAHVGEVAPKSPKPEVAPVDRRVPAGHTAAACLSAGPVRIPVRAVHQWIRARAAAGAEVQVPGGGFCAVIGIMFISIKAIDSKVGRCPLLWIDRCVCGGCY